MSKKIFAFAALFAATSFAAWSERAFAALNDESPIWAQAQGDVRADPAVRFGTLANGMRYAILKNSSVPGEVSLRLRIGAAALQERDEQQGLAHVLEHMAFKGSTHVPGGEMIKMLQRIGLAFGPDLNATTGTTETVYKLDLPKSDRVTLDTAFMLLREIASELTLSAEALEPERGVVLSELRWRDTPARRIFAARTAFLLNGRLASQRFGLGKAEVVSNAPIALVADYYRAHYRPDRATLVVAGDIDPAEIEDMSRSVFGGWSATEPAPLEPDLGEVEAGGLKTSIVLVPGATTQAEISWVKAYNDAPDTEARRRAELIDFLGLSVLRQRLFGLARAKSPPFIGANATYGNFLRSAKIASLSATSTPDGWQRALAAIEQEQRRIVQYGVLDDELQLAISEHRKQLEQAVVQAASRPVRQLTEAMVTSVDLKRVYTSAADDLARYERIVGSLTVTDVNATLGHIFEGSGPMVQLITPTPVEGGEKVLEAEYAKAHDVPLKAPEARTAVEWPYKSFGSPTAIAERRDLSDLGVTLVRFENGVTLNVKPTPFKKGEIHVRVRIGHGRLDLPSDSSGWVTKAFLAGGLGAMPVGKLQRALISKVVNTTFTMADDAFLLDGRTRPQDFTEQLQLLAAYITDPAFRPEALERVRAEQLAVLNQMEVTASGVSSHDLARVMHGSDPRWGEPDAESVKKATSETLKALLQGPLAEGAIELTIVGDVEVDAAIKEVSETFGAFANRKPPSPSGTTANIAVPSGTLSPVRHDHKGREDDAVAFISWRTADFFADVSQSLTLEIAAEILKNRVTDQLRVKEGATYSPAGGAYTSYRLNQFGYVWSRVETQPNKVDGFFETVTRIAADMRANGVTDDELARAKTPYIERFKKARLSNDYWIGALTGSQADARKLDLARTIVQGYENVSANNVKNVASTFLTDDRSFKFVVLPAAKSQE